MTDPGATREALAALTAYERETNKVLVLVAELLVEQNDLLREQLEQQRKSAPTVVNNNVVPVDTSAGVGRPAAGDPPAGKEAAAMRLTEPDVPPVGDDQDTTGGRPTPAPAKNAAAAPVNKTAQSTAKSPRPRGQGGR